MVEAEGNDELRAHALNTIGLAKENLGDVTGRDDLQRALEIARASRSPQTGSIANNVAAVAWRASMDLSRGGALFEEGLEVARRFGDPKGALFLEGQLPTVDGLRGDWDLAMRRADAFIAECEAAGTSHYKEADVRSWRARIQLARGATEAAIAEHRRVIELVEAAPDPQQLLPNFGAAALTFELLGLADEADALARRIVAVATEAPHEAAWPLTLDFLLGRIALRFEEPLRVTLEAAPPWPWRTLALACLDRDFVRAAEMWAAGGSPAWEARLRLRAAEELVEGGQRAEGEVQLEQALPFFRSVGATFFLERAEALLAKAG